MFTRGLANMVDNSSDEAETDTSRDNENVGPLEKAAQAEADLRVPQKADVYVNWTMFNQIYLQFSFGLAVNCFVVNLGFHSFWIYNGMSLFITNLVLSTIVYPLFYQDTCSHLFKTMLQTPTQLRYVS